MYAPIVTVSAVTPRGSAWSLCAGGAAIESGIAGCGAGSELVDGSAVPEGGAAEGPGAALPAVAGVPAVLCAAAAGAVEDGLTSSAGPGLTCVSAEPRADTG